MTFLLIAKAVQLFNLFTTKRERERDPICHISLTHTVTVNGRSNQILYRKPNMQMCLQQFSKTYFRAGDLRKEWGGGERKKKMIPGKIK